MRMIVLCLMGLIVMTCPAIAQTPLSGKTMYLLGPGAKSSCGKWVSERSAATTTKRSEIADAMASWAFGFLTAVGMYVPHLNPLANVDADAVSVWLDNYCRERPLDPFGLAVIGFVNAHPR
jgi:hypothetical protein